MCGVTAPLSRTCYWRGVQLSTLVRFVCQQEQFSLLTAVLSVSSEMNCSFHHLSVACAVIWTAHQRCERVNACSCLLQGTFFRFLWEAGGLDRSEDPVHVPHFEFSFPSSVQRGLIPCLRPEFCTVFRYWRM